MPETAAPTITPNELVQRARQLVNVAALTTSAEYDTVTALDSRLTLGLTTEEAATVIRALLNTLGDVGRCKGCGLTIWWVATRNGRRAPYQAAGLNHFADCPGAQKFKRRATR